VAAAAPRPTNADSIGEIERLFLNDPNDLWSGGSMVVGGQFVILPRNLLIDLPANRMTLQQLFMRAPEACRQRGESGLAKVDVCNATGTGGIATATANRTSTGNVIAGDLFIAKGLQNTSGAVTYIDHSDGFFRLNGNPGDPNTGVMVRLNDPTGRHTVQQGKGCDTKASAGPNCSPDPRFMLDSDNYTNTFSTGYPYCLPSTVARTFVDVLDTNGNGNTAERLTSQGTAAGTGDTLCPDANRATDVAVDSRRFAPLQLGDSITVKGNFETIGGVRFLSAHSSTISVALSTTGAADQPDYVILNEMYIDAPGFYRERARDQFLGATTEADSDVNIWTVHRDPKTNAAHEFPIASVLGCETAAGPLTCRRVLGPHTFRVRHDVDFLVGANAKLNPCIQLMADARFAFDNLCPQGGTIAEQFGILSPISKEVQLRTGHELADKSRAGGPILKSVDVRGTEATHGQYLFPMGVGLGGIELPAFAEINVGLLDNPRNFEGLPWTLDRRLSPNGCMGAGGCEATPQLLDPYPASGIDPRNTGNTTPNPPFDNPTYTASMLSFERDRMLSFVSPDPAVNNFDGDKTVLACCPAEPPYQTIAQTPDLNGINVPPTTYADSASTATDTAGNIDVLGNDVANDDPIDPGSVSIDTAAVDGTAAPNAEGTITYTPNPGFTGTDTFRYRVKDQIGASSNASTVTVTVAPAPAPAPALSGISPASGLVGDQVTLTGTNLSGVTSVLFGGVATGSFTVNAAGTQISTRVPGGGATGSVSVTAPGGTAATADTFTVIPPAPTVTGVNPISGIEGDPVTITGTGLATVSTVSFNGAIQTVFQSVSDTQIKTSVPIGAPNGTNAVVVTTSGGTTNGGSFTVNPPPATVHEITSISPTSGPVGTVVSINGTGLTGVTGVTIGGVAATQFTSNSSTSVSVAVPPDAVSGSVVVRRGGGDVVGPTYTVVAALTSPAAPVAGTATPGNGRASLTWTAPADGGSPITGYTVQAVRVSTGAVTAVTVGPTATSGTVTGLSNGTTYQLRVQAINNLGPSGFSGLSNVVKPGTVPGAPAIGTATGGGTADHLVTALARWTAPVSTGGSPITQYSVTAIRRTTGKRTTKLVAATARSATISGLAAGATYTFVVSAVNAIGTGATSAASNSVVAR